MKDRTQLRPRRDSGDGDARRTLIEHYRPLRADMRGDIAHSLSVIAPRRRSILAAYYGQGLSLSSIGRWLRIREAAPSRGPKVRTARAPA